MLTTTHSKMMMKNVMTFDVSKRVRSMVWSHRESLLLLLLAIIGGAERMEASPQLSVSKTIQGGLSSVSSGTSFTYVINWANPSITQDAIGAVLEDVLPPQLSWAAVDVAFSSSTTYVTNAVYDPATGKMTWRFISPLAAGTSGQFTLTAKFPNGTTPNGTVAVNTAKLTQSDGTTVTSSPASITATASPSLSSSKSLTAGVAAGDLATYTVSASSGSGVGTVNLTNVIFQDNLPAGSVFISATDGGTVDGTGKVVTWPATSLAIGSSVSHSITIQYPTPTFAVNQRVTNFVSAIGTPLGVTTPVTNTASQVATLGNPVSYLSVSKSLTSGGAVNQNTVYNVTASNSSSSNTGLTNVVVIDTLPSGATFVSASNGGTSSGNTVTWPATSLAVGGSLNYAVTVVYPTPTFAVGGKVTNNVAVIAAPPGTSLPITNTASVTTTLVDPSTFLAVTKTVASGGALGQPVSYTVTASNPSSSGITLTNVVLTDVIPTGATYVSSTGSGVYSAASGTVTWPAATLTSGNSISQTIVITYPSPTFSVGNSVTNVVNAVGVLPGGTSVTKSAQVAVTLTSSSSLLTSAKTVVSGGAVGNNVIYSVTGQNPSSSGVTLTNLVLVDYLPTNSVFVSATGSGTYSASANTVTWPATSITSGNSYVQYVTVSYPSSLFTTSKPVTNVLAVNGFAPGAVPVSSNSTNILTLASATDSLGFSKAASATVATINSTTINYTLNSTNTGNTVLTNYQVVDILPTGLTVTSLQIDPVSSKSSGVTAGTATLEYSTSVSAPYSWVALTSANNTAFFRKNSNVPAGITAIRWTFSAVPPGFTAKNSLSSSAGSGFSAKIAATVSDATVIQNCASYSYTTTYGTPAQRTGSSCVNVTASNGQTAALVATKAAVTTTSVNPGDTVTYKVGIVAGNANASIVSPVLADLLPAGMTYVSGSWAVASGSTATPTLFESIANYNGTGRTLLRWTYTGTAVTTTEINVTFQATVPTVTSPGTTYSNTAYIVGWSNTSVSGNTTTDTNDLNGNGSTSDKIAASSPVIITVNRAASLNSLKYVIGQLDVDYSRYPNTGNSVPGGIANYKLTVQNSGDVSLTNLLIVDILPFVGDTGVKDPSPRNSAWRPFLASTVTAPSGVTVYYSTNQNPTRPEIGITTSQNDWTTVAPSDLTTVQALKFDFGRNVLGTQDQQELNWAMRVPVNAPTNGSIAWNSFAVVATPTDTLIPFDPTEPIKVGITAQPIKPAAFGDFVWNDLNRNGIQDSGEPGVDSVRVELYSHTGTQTGPDPTKDSYIGFTLTSGGGKYLFSKLDPGSYYAVFFPRRPTWRRPPCKAPTGRSIPTEPMPRFMASQPQSARFTHSIVVT